VAPGFFFVSGFLARKMLAPPTSPPTSCPNAPPTMEKFKQRAAEIKNAARSIALALIITLLLLCKIETNP
jgi:hypothetical protein